MIDPDPRYPEHARWEHRKHLSYYGQVLAWIEHYRSACPARYWSIMDVGSHDCPIVSVSPGFARRTAVDLVRGPDDERVVWYQNDFMDPNMTYPKSDVVLCLHVLEHQEDPSSFFERLFEHANELLIIGTPYAQSPDLGTNPEYPPDHHVHHRHWHITVATLYEWCNRAPSMTWEDNGRLLAAYCRGAW